MPWEKIDWTMVGTGILFVLAVIFQAVKGVMGGRQRPHGLEPGAIEVMGDVLVVKKLDGMITAVDMNTVALSDKKVALTRNTAAAEALLDAIVQARAAVEHHTKVSIEVHRHAEELAREMRELREVSKDLREENGRLRDELLRGSRPR